MNSPPESGFAPLGISSALGKAVADLGFLRPTPVQVAAIPAVLRGGDLWVSARTGSGKTAAFALPLLETLSTKRDGGARRAVQVLVLVPTRELAMQVATSFGRYSAGLSSTPVVRAVFGGVSPNPQMLALRGGADIVVGTPGRVLDLVRQNALRLEGVRALVLDEADRMLSLGFAEEIADVLRHLPQGRQNLFFSATFPPAVRSLALAILRDPTRIDVEAGAPLGESSVKQRAIAVDDGVRMRLLVHLLEQGSWSQALVFVASRNAAADVARKLFQSGVAALALFGELGQGARTRALADFKAGRVRILVATDVAGRGLDIAHLPLVVNFDLPRSPVDYLHRIGRTGRAGEVGEAISFVSAKTEAHLRLIEKRHRLQIPREKIDGFFPVELAPPTADPHGGRKGARRSKKDKLREAALRRAEGEGGRDE